jgi:NitT/TauT family transport system substrate-binding protein
MFKRRNIQIAMVVITMAAVTLLWSCQQSPESQSGPVAKLTIGALIPSFSSYTIYVAFEKDCFKEQGLDVTLESFPHGKASLEALMEGKVDFATSSETPFMHAVSKGGKICLVASMITGEKHLAVVGRKDRGISAPKDLKGKRIGVTTGSNGEYFLDTVLLLNGVSRDQVETVNVKPKKMFEVLKKGDVDAIATWNPQMSQALKALGEKGVAFYAEGLYSPAFVISAKKEYVRKNPETVQRVVRALVNASQIIAEDPEGSRAIVARHLGTDKDLLGAMSATYHFRITLDQSLLATLENQCKWAIGQGIAGHKKIPNYLDFICTGALETVDSNAVTIIR